MPAIPRPAPDEYAPYFGGYIDEVPPGDVLEILDRQMAETQALLRSLPESRALHRYAPGKWSIKEVVGHVSDAERIFTYRALCFSRNERAPLPGFEEDEYVAAAGFDTRSLADLARELESVRAATLTLFRGLSDELLLRRGTANAKPYTVRAIAFIIAGHERHHVRVLRERYL
jgi:uncharacterized damage-inducible protein DinB